MEREPRCLRNNRGHRAYNNESKLCWNSRRVARNEESVEEVVCVQCRWLKRPAVLTRMRLAETKRGPKRRKGEGKGGVGFPLTLTNSHRVWENLCHGKWNVSNARATEKYRRTDHFLRSFHEWCINLGFNHAPSMFIVIAERAISAFWVDRTFGSTSTHVVERREEGEGGMGFVSPKGFTPRARPLFKSDFQRDPLQGNEGRESEH